MANLFYVHFFLLCFMFTNNATYRNNNKLKVTILYESMCPDSLEFITKQLYPNWRRISAFVDLEFIPFGKSKSYNQGQRFQCQHGPRECHGNRVQSCALALLPNQHLQVKFVNCFMLSFNKDENDEYAQNCARLVGLPSEDIATCYVKFEATILQLQAELTTNLYKPTFIPTIIYDGEFDQTAQMYSLTNFVEFVCFKVGC